MEKKEKNIMNEENGRNVKQENLENVAGGFNFGKFADDWSKGLGMVRDTVSTLDNTVDTLGHTVGSIGDTVNKAKGDFVKHSKKSMFAGDDFFS